MNEKQIIEMYWSGFTIKRIIDEAYLDEKTRPTKLRRLKQDVRLYVETTILAEHNRAVREGFK